MIRPSLILGLLALAACSPRSQPAAAPISESPAPTPAQTPLPQATPTITTEGYGPLRIGMTRAEVIAALGPDANPGAVGGPDEEACDMFRPDRAPQGFLVMIENGILTSIHATGTSSITTDKGLKPGDPAAKVKEVYGAALLAEPHKYSDPPAQYLTVWSTTTHDTAQSRGIRYEIGPDGKIASIASGGPSIAYVEGCA